MILRICSAFLLCGAVLEREGERQFKMITGKRREMGEHEREREGE